MQSSHKQTGRAPEKTALGHGSNESIDPQGTVSADEIRCSSATFYGGSWWLGGQFALARCSVSKQEIEKR
jgi:hypothetical protein